MDDSSLPNAQPFAGSDNIIKLARYRFWLSFASLFTAAVFGTLGLGAFSAGEGLAGDASQADYMRVIITFGIVGAVLLAFTGICLYLAWRFRPGGG